MGLEDVAGEQLRAAVDKRREILDAVHDEARGKPALVDALDVSRSTVDRAIADLMDAGLVERENGVYRVTVSGVLARQMHDDYIRQTDSLATAVPVVNAVHETDRLDPVILDGADIQVAEPRAPEGALERAITELRHGDEFYGFIQVVKSTYVSLLHEQVTTGDLDVEVIVSQDARGSLGSLAHGREQLIELFMNDSFDVLETEQEVPYALWLIEGEDKDLAGLTIHDAGGIVGTVINDNEDAVGWAKREYERVRDTANRLPADLLG